MMVKAAIDSAALQVFACLPPGSSAARSARLRRGADVLGERRPVVDWAVSDAASFPPAAPASSISFYLYLHLYLSLYLYLFRHIYIIPPQKHAGSRHRSNHFIAVAPRAVNGEQKFFRRGAGSCIQSLSLPWGWNAGISRAGVLRSFRLRSPRLTRPGEDVEGRGFQFACRGGHRQVYRADRRPRQLRARAFSHQGKFLFGEASFCRGRTV
jgi:hypothetical protein